MQNYWVLQSVFEHFEMLGNSSTTTAQKSKSLLIKSIKLPATSDNSLKVSEYPSQPTFQRRINVVSTLWINFEITLIRRWKWNKIRRQIFNDAQRCYNVGARRWNNVEITLHNVGTTLIQRCFNLALTLVKTILNPIELVMIMDLQIHE